MAHSWLQGLLLACLLGFLGQGLRVMAGLKKVHDEAAAKDSSVGSELDLGRLLVSLLIGMVASGTSFLLMDIDVTQPLSRDTLLSLLGIGYAGTDAIEALIRKAGKG